MSNTSSQAPASTVPLPTKPDQNIIRVAKGGSLVFSGKLFTFICRFVIGILLARILQADQYGLYNLTLTVATVASGLAPLGLKDAVVRYVALFSNRKDEAGLWGVLQISLGITSVVSTLLGLGMYIFADAIAIQLFKEPQLAPLLRLASLFVPIQALSDILAAATRGFKNMKYTTIAQDVLQPLIRLVLTISLAIIGMSAMGAVVIFGVAIANSLMTLLYFLNKQFSLKRPLHTARRDVKEILLFSIPVYISDLIKTFSGNIQTILLGTLNTIANVGIFTVAVQLNRVGDLFHLAIVMASMPIVSELYDQGEREKLARLYKTMSKWSFTLNLPFFLIVLLFPNQIMSVFGHSFVGGAAALIILTWTSVVNTGTGIAGVMLDMSGYTFWKMVNTALAIILTITTNVLLIPSWGLLGAATAALISETTVNLLRVLEVFVLLRLHPYEWSFLKPIMAGGAAVGVSLVVSRLLAIETNLFYTIINMTLLMGVYVGVIFLLGLSQEDQAVLARLNQRLRVMLLGKKGKENDN